MDKGKKPSEREAFRLIEAMLELMEQRGLVELEMEHEGLRIRLRKAAAGPQHQPSDPCAAAPAGPAMAAPAPAPPDADAGKATVTSPMVGTFYRASAPDAPPFVEVGQQIEPGQVLCIIEAMKLMNEIKSEVHGVITDIRAQNGDPVEFGQTLFVVEPRE